MSRFFTVHCVHVFATNTVCASYCTYYVASTVDDNGKCVENTKCDPQITQTTLLSN